MQTDRTAVRYFTGVFHVFMMQFQLLFMIEMEQKRNPYIVLFYIVLNML